VLCCAKAAVEAGARQSVIAEMLACAQRDFCASQREIGGAIGRSASSVNRLLKWRRSGYKNRSPFGPTTRAGRNASRTGSAEHKDHGAGGLESEKQKLSAAEHANSWQKRTPERMQIVIEALREQPFLERAAAKAGIHRKTLAYWLKCSEAGRDGYDVDGESFEWRFHEACEAAIDEAHQRLRDALFSAAMGPPTYTRDENGNCIVEFRELGNVKIHERLLELMLPEKYGKARKRKIATWRAVLVVGERFIRAEKKCGASIKARQWKAALRLVEEAKI
jgi:hypothetical protein